MNVSLVFLRKYFSDAKRQNYRFKQPNIETDLFLSATIILLSIQIGIQVEIFPKNLNKQIGVEKNNQGTKIP